MKLMNVKTKDGLQKNCFATLSLLGENGKHDRLKIYSFGLLVLSYLFGQQIFIFMKNLWFWFKKKKKIILVLVPISHINETMNPFQL